MREHRAPMDGAAERGCGCRPPATWSHLMGGAACALALAGCATTPPPPVGGVEAARFLREQVVVAGRDGGAEDPLADDACRPADVPAPPRRRAGEAEEDRVGPVVAALRRRLDAERAAGQEGPLRVVVFVHGGLSLREEVCKRALRDAELLKELDDGRTYPIFLTWSSEGLDSYGDEIVNIAEGERHNDVFLSAFGPVQLATDPLGGIARAPVSAVRQMRGLGVGLGYQLGLDAIADNRLFPENHPELRTPDNAGDPAKNVVFLKEGAPRSWGQVAKESVRWPLVPALLVARVGLTPIFDGYGVTTWRSLKRRAFVSVRRDFQDEGSFEEEVNPEQAARRRGREPGVDGVRLPRPKDATWLEAACPEGQRAGLPTHASRPPDGAFGAFALELTRLLSAPAGRGTYRDLVALDLVGHSMGGIVINEILHELPCLSARNLVYLASADSLDHLDKTAIPYLQGKAGQRTQAYFVSLHPISEATEDVFPLFPVIPRGSLLHWIDTMYEPSPRVLAKTMGSWYNIVRYRELVPPDVMPRATFASYGFDEGTPRKHGDFSGFACARRPDRQASSGPPCAAGEVLTYAWWDSAFWGAEARTPRGRSEPAPPR